MDAARANNCSVGTRLPSRGFPVQKKLLVQVKRMADNANEGYRLPVQDSSPSESNRQSGERESQDRY